MKKIIMYLSGVCNEKRVTENLQKLGMELFCIRQDCTNYDADAELAKNVLFKIHEVRAEAVFSLDYYPILAETAHTAGIPYISWIIDSPHYTLYSMTSFYDSSWIFHFDREGCERLKGMGRPNVYHSSLASDPEYFAQSRKDHPLNELEVTFLGSSYQGQHDYFERQEGLTEYECGFLNALLNVQSNVYGCPLLEEALDEKMARRIMKACSVKRPESYDIPEKMIAASILEKRLSVLERSRMVEAFAKDTGIHLYSGDKRLVRDGVSYEGYADYETVMSSVFYYSKINLNPTLRTIHSGITLRALDIMASGGFLLSNYQPELAEQFEDGISLALYGSTEEMMDKAHWYLEHEEERSSVARAGQEIIEREFTYEKVLSRILATVQ